MYRALLDLAATGARRRARRQSRQRSSAAGGAAAARARRGDHAPGVRRAGDGGRRDLEPRWQRNDAGRAAAVPLAALDRQGQRAHGRRRRDRGAALRGALPPAVQVDVRAASAPTPSTWSRLTRSSTAPMPAAPNGRPTSVGGVRRAVHGVPEQRALRRARPSAPPAGDPRAVSHPLLRFADGPRLRRGRPAEGRARRRGVGRHAGAGHARCRSRPGARCRS